MKPHCFILLFVLLVGTSLIAQEQQKCLSSSPTTNGRVEYVDKARKICFLLDSGWEVRCNCECFSSSSTCICLRPKGFLSDIAQSECEHNSWLIVIEVFKGNFDKWLDEGPFELRGVKYYYAGGRMGASREATAIKGQGWSGLFGCGNTGCYKKGGGGYIGDGVEVCTALISDGAITALIVFSYDGNYDIDQTFLETFKFLK
jgi:hypothetical protein